LLKKAEKLLLNTGRGELRCAEALENRAAFLENAANNAQSVAKQLPLERTHGCHLVECVV
jgi:hypothetical protein